MIKRFVTLLPVIFLLAYTLLVYKPFILKGFLPIPADTIVGLYHPWRDTYAAQYPNGIPYQNSLITDAVRQQYPWRQLAVDQIKSGQLPNWNPYAFSGYPLSANLQSSPFYPLNFLYWLMSFPIAWTFQIMAQTVLGGFFMVLFLRNLNLRREAVILGSIAWIGSGFFVSWLTSNVVVQTVIWLPLIFWAIDKIFSGRNKISFLVLTFSFCAAFFAGHLQSDFYILVAAGLYALWKSVTGKSYRPLFVILFSFALFALITIIQWGPFAHFLLLSGRDLDQAVWQKADWFIPWQHLSQFLAPDYFGNPATLNYFGIWNYAEFVGYIGVIPLFFAFLSVYRKKEKNFFLSLLILALIMALPTFIAKIPFQLGVPFLSSGQPSRLLSIIDFSLAVLSALGLDWFLTQTHINKKKIFLFVGLITILFIPLWGVAYISHNQVSLRNLVIPSAMLAALISFVMFYFFAPGKRNFFVLALLLVVVLDLSRFATKFIPFTSPEWLYPQTKVTNFLTGKAKTDVFRVALLDDRIMAPNFSVVYKLQSTAGYDPLYLSNYAKFIAALERGRANIDPPWGYSRQIQPHNYQNKLFNLLNAKYVLSLYDLNFPGYLKVEQEGETRVYENDNVLPRTFFVSTVVPSRNDQQAIDNMYDPDFNPANKAVVESYSGDKQFSMGKATIEHYTDNKISIITENEGPGFLVLTDIYYPGWQAIIDGQKTVIFQTDFTFRGVVVPQGKHSIVFSL